MTFEEKIHDFGTINEVDGPVSYSFEFTNTGDEPLVIINANLLEMWTSVKCQRQKHQVYGNRVQRKSCLAMDFTMIQLFQIVIKTI